MPNGGSDCCGTCWFKARREQESVLTSATERPPLRCSIRNLPIESPFYTYCGNHPRRRSERDSIPIGPVFMGDSSGERWFWKPSPDTEAIRQHLLSLLAAHDPQERSEYPIGIYLVEVVIWQLGEFREPRAIPGLQRIVSFESAAEPPDPFGPNPGGLAALAREAIAKIQTGSAQQPPPAFSPSH